MEALTPMELKILLYALTLLLAVIAFIGGVFVRAFLKMASDINEIKTDVKVASTKHEDLERRVSNLEER